MNIKKILVAGVAAVTLGSLAIVPSAAFAQASPGSSDNTGTIVAATVPTAAILFAIIEYPEWFGLNVAAPVTALSRNPAVLAHNSASTKRVRQASKARKYNWNLALAR